MDNKRYEVRRDFAKGQDILTSLPKSDREKVDSAIESLAKDPFPQRYSAKSLDKKAAKMTVPVEDDEITILYEVDIYGLKVDLIEIKRRGGFKKAGDWLGGLLKFEPK